MVGLGCSLGGNRAFDPQLYDVLLQLTHPWHTLPHPLAKEAIEQAARLASCQVAVTSLDVLCQGCGGSGRVPESSREREWEGFARRASNPAHCAWPRSCVLTISCLPVWSQMQVLGCRGRCFASERNDHSNEMRRPGSLSRKVTIHLDPAAEDYKPWTKSISQTLPPYASAHWIFLGGHSFRFCPG